MKEAKIIMLAAATVSLTVATSHGTIFSDFEAPTFTADTELNGQGGWTTTIGSPARGRVTPAFDADLAQNINTVLDGSQSVYVKSAVHAARGWNGLESSVNDGLVISFLMQVDANTRTELYLSPDIVGLSTPIGVLFDGAGNIRVQTPNSGNVDTGENYLLDKTYRFTMSVDFTGGTVAFTGQNVTDGGPVNNYPTGNTGAIDPIDYQTGGGLLFLERDGAHAFYDTITVVPEPATALLLALGGLTMLGRRRAT